MALKDQPERTQPAIEESVKRRVTMRSPGSSLFFQDIDLKNLLIVSLTLATVVSVIHGLSDMNIAGSGRFPLGETLKHFYRYAACAFLGLTFAEKINLQPFLIRRPHHWFGRSRLLTMVGIIPGIVVGVAYHQLFAQYRSHTRVPFYLRQMDGYYDTFILSLQASATEELVFRLFLFTAFYYILQRLFQPLMTQGSVLAKWIPYPFALVFSSLLFGYAHGTFGFLMAFFAGMLLCGIFLRGGLESALAAHFLADFIFFNLTYLP